MGWTAEVPFLAGAKGYSLLHSVETGSGPHPASTGTVSPGVKQPGREPDHSTADIKNGGTIPPLLHTSS
jgi:hypothetical protein